MRPLISALLAITIVGGDTVLTAQTPPRPDRTDRRPRRWEISWTVGASKGGSARAIAAAMSTAGLNSTIPAGCFLFYCGGPIPHPVTNDGSPTGTFALSYAVRPGYTLRLQWNTADLGETMGYREHSGWLFLRQSVTSVSALVVVSAGGLQAGGGPALHRPEIARTDAQGGRWRRTRIGMTFHAGLSLPVRTRLFGHVAVQRQLVGSMAVGPFSTADSSATMPRTHTSFSHHTIKLGLGIRI